MQPRVGDKVRVKTGSHSGRRGIIKAIKDGTLWVQLEDSSRIVSARPETVTNYSLAARKAWRTEPNRGVGRRKGTRLTDRVSVTLRLDRDLWIRFQEKENAGIIGDRPGTINSWLREKLDRLDDTEPTS